MGQPIIIIPRPASTFEQTVNEAVEALIFSDKGKLAVLIGNQYGGFVVVLRNLSADKYKLLIKVEQVVSEYGDADEIASMVKEILSVYPSPNVSVWGSAE